ncbi:MAG: hypothetical protein LWW87_06305 [Geobacteraceae bacterium]|nr:hypothetical protein [Geobacteraceae bacterium]
MQIIRIVMFVAASALCFSATSHASEIEQRVRRAYEQIDRGIQSGDITRDEARRLKGDFKKIRDDEERLNNELDRLERNIYRAKNNDNRKDDYRGHDDFRGPDRGHHQVRWERCAGEGENCRFRGTREIRYGAGDRWSYRSQTNSITCNNAVFGDPAPGTPKACYIKID